MGVSGILRGYPNTLAQPQHKVLVYLAVYRAPCKARKPISRYRDIRMWKYNDRDMEIDIVTREDLRQFKREMLDEFKQIIGNREKDNLGREWLKSAEVRKLLGVSPGTLQNLRAGGTLPYRKVGGSMYYHREDIRKMMEGGNDNG
ncbi:hypothetical protein GCM10011386_43450 [Parapedobacter defluvii]|uniref:Helix-turn-helix domain-containing protein n=2 Tax=Parapedobacter defluvii TaxID=2045106 RepID=A0ABQ1N0E2_9SPHI|nr:hypothetical protein GCM10011386_43450 [Parapedobacter defluvii]